MLRPVPYIPVIESLSGIQQGGLERVIFIVPFLGFDLA